MSDERRQAIQRGAFERLGLRGDETVVAIDGKQVGETPVPREQLYICPVCFRAAFDGRPGYCTVGHQYAYERVLYVRAS